MNFKGWKYGHMVFRPNDIQAMREQFIADLVE